MLLSFQLVTRNSRFTISHTHTQPVYHKNVVLRILSLFYVATGNSFYYGKSINIYQEMIKGLICWWVKIIKFSKSERKKKRFGGFFKNLARSITPKQKVDLKFCQKRYPPKKKKKFKSNLPHVSSCYSCLSPCYSLLSSPSTTNIFFHYLSSIKPISYHSPYISMLSGILQELKQNIGNHRNEKEHQYEIGKESVNK